MAALIFGIIGSIGTIVGLITAIMNRRVKISFDIYGAFQSDYGILMYASITNCSGISISIDDISLIARNGEYHCERIPRKVLTLREKSGKTVTQSEDLMSCTFPINLYPFSGQAAYFWFPLENRNLPVFDKVLTLEIHSIQPKTTTIQIDMHKVPPLRNM